MTEASTDVGSQLKAIRQMPPESLRALWHSAFGTHAPGWMHKGFLVQALSYRLQEKIYGGLSAAQRRRLAAYADEVRRTGHVAIDTGLKIKPGTRIVRQWRGDTYVVTALDTDFEFRGKRYESLSEIARTITGTRWSGPAFFGLKNPSKPSGKPR